MGPFVLNHLPKMPKDSYISMSERLMVAHVLFVLAGALR